MAQGERRKIHVNLTLIILVGFILLSMLFLIFWGPYLSSGVAIERHKWDLELTKRRLDEQQRVEKWERQFKERLHQERIRQDRWERDLKERRLDEQVRMEAWEHQLQTRKRQEKVRQDKWEQKQKDIRREEEARQERERLREEQWQRDEEQRQRLGLYWAEPEANARCTAYSTRDYRARLLNTVPYHYNWLKPCEEIPIVIHGRSIHATRCEIKQDGSGEVYGHWRVDFDEPACSPYWDQFKDKGCTAEGSHKRRIEAHLENIHSGEDWEKLCASAPHDFYGRHFDWPDSCANWGGYGIFGIWDISDPDC
jgi:hypothetical protein